MSVVLFAVGDKVRENWSGIVGTIVGGDQDGQSLVQWPSGRRKLVSNKFLVHARKG